MSPSRDGYNIGVGQWGALFATILNMRAGKATQAEVDQQVAAILDRIESDQVAVEP